MPGTLKDSLEEDANAGELLHRMLEENKKIMEKCSMLENQLHHQQELITALCSKIEMRDQHRDPRPLSVPTTLPVCKGNPRLHQRKEATQELCWMAIFCSHLTPENVLDVASLVKAGADIWYVRRCDMRHPIFHTFVANGCVEVVRTIMQTAVELHSGKEGVALDFTQADDAGCTPLHLVCTECPRTSALAMLHAMIDGGVSVPLSPSICSFACSPDSDESVTEAVKVNWEQENSDNLNFINAAAACGRLSLLGDAIERISYFKNLPEGAVELKVGVLQEDWNHLTEAEQKTYVTKEKRATDTLADICDKYKCDSGENKMVAGSRIPEKEKILEAVRKCVQAGADVTWQVPGGSVRVLSKFMADGFVEAVKTCLQSPQLIDFTLGDGNGWTPLHWISPGRKTAEHVAALLELVIDRVQERLATAESISAAVALASRPRAGGLAGFHFLAAQEPHSPAPTASRCQSKREFSAGEAVIFSPPSAAAHLLPDVVNWGAKDLSGQECVSLAAAYGYLALWWSVVKRRNVLYYTSRDSPIRITRPVRRSDWEKIAEEDQQRFELVRGIR